MDFKIIRICQEHCDLRDRLDRFPLRSRQWHRKWFRLGTAVLGCNCYEPMSIGIIGPVSYCGFILDSLGTTVWLAGILHSQYMSISHWRNHEFSKDQAATAKAETWKSVVEIRQTPWAPCDFLPVPSKMWHDHKRIYIQLVHWLGFSTCTVMHNTGSKVWTVSNSFSSASCTSRTSFFFQIGHFFGRKWHRTLPTLMGWSATSRPVRCWFGVVEDGCPNVPNKKVS